MLVSQSKKRRGRWRFDISICCQEIRVSEGKAPGYLTDLANRCLVRDCWWFSQFVGPRRIWSEYLKLYGVIFIECNSPPQATNSRLRRNAADNVYPSDLEAQVFVLFDLTKWQKRIFFTLSLLTPEHNSSRLIIQWKYQKISHLSKNRIVRSTSMENERQINCTITALLNENSFIEEISVTITVLSKYHLLQWVRISDKFYHREYNRRCD